jgi:hypothetical protein
LILIILFPFHFDIGRLALSNREIVAAQVHFDGIADGGDLDDGYLRPFKDAHVHDAALKRAFA